MSAAELGSRLRPFLSQAPITLCVTRDRKQGSTETPGWWPWSPGRNGQSAHLPGTSLSRRAGGCRTTGGSAWGHAHRVDARDPRACARVQAVGQKNIGRVWSLILNLASPCVCRVALGKGLGFLICEMGKPRIWMREC